VAVYPKPTMVDTAAVKASLRQRLRGQRVADPAAATRAAAHFWRQPEAATLRLLLAFAPLPDELDPTPLVAEARRRGVAVAYPRCEFDGLRLYRVDDETALATGRYGLQEPDPDRALPVDPSDVDVALVPALAVDSRGYRLGRGGGHYDRLLAHPHWRAWRVGFVPAARVRTELPVDPWDVPLDAFLTEEGLWRLR